jgi:hypothetical protein
MDGAVIRNRLDLNRAVLNPLERKLLMHRLIQAVNALTRNQALKPLELKLLMLLLQLQRNHVVRLRCGLEMGSRIMLDLVCATMDKHMFAFNVTSPNLLGHQPTVEPYGKHPTVVKVDPNLVHNLLIHQHSQLIPLRVPLVDHNLVPILVDHNLVLILIQAPQLMGVVLVLLQLSLTQQRLLTPQDRVKHFQQFHQPLLH